VELIEVGVKSGWWRRCMCLTPMQLICFQPLSMRTPSIPKELEKELKEFEGTFESNEILET
jgi:hypothetical protein